MIDNNNIISTYQSASNAEQEKVSIEIYLKEYEKLKDEQMARIGFRDNFIYATLIAISGILSFGLSSAANYPMLLLLPLACFVLGWTYLVNDEKISAIGRYIRTDLVEELRKASHHSAIRLLEWEETHRSDRRRVSRKVLQFLVDILTFVGSGFVSVIIYWQLTSGSDTLLIWATVGDILLLLVLAVQIFIYADFSRQQ